MWMILQQDKPDDYVLATGETHTVKEFIEVAFGELGMQLKWEGKGVDERGIDLKTGKILVGVDPLYFRPTEVDLLIGDASKAKAKFGWEPKIKFEELAKMMVNSDFEKIKKRGY